MDIGTSFGDFMFAYWWLLFPLAFFVAGGWNSFMRFQRSKAKIELLKTYAAAGKEPPKDLVDSLNKDSTDEDWQEMDERHSSNSGGGSNAFLVILFAGFAGVFYLEAQMDWLGIGNVAYFIALIMGVLSLSFLASAMFGGRNRRSGD